MKDSQRLFVTKYVQNGCKNATEAAIAAGYSPKTAYSQANRLLKNVEIKEAIEKFLAEEKTKALITREKVIEDLKEVAARCMQHQPVMEFDKAAGEYVQKKALVQDEETGQLKEVGIYEFDAAGANKALELLGKTMKMFVDKLEVKDTTDRADAIAKARQRATKKVQGDEQKP